MTNKMMTVEQYNAKSKALMEANKKANAGKPEKPPVKPTGYKPAKKK